MSLDLIAIFGLHQYFVVSSKIRLKHRKEIRLSIKATGKPHKQRKLKVDSSSLFSFHVVNLLTRMEV